MQTSSKAINDFSAAMSGYFYQCWADFAPDGMVSVVQKIYSDGAQTNNHDMIDAIDAILYEIEGGKDFRELFPGVTGEYNPRADGMSVVEWLVLLKQYMEGNHSVFDHKTLK